MNQYSQYPQYTTRRDPLAGAGSSFLWGMGHAGRKKKEQQQMLLEMFKSGFVPKKSDRPKQGGLRGALQNIGEAWSPRMPEWEMAPHHPVMADRASRESGQEHDLNIRELEFDHDKKMAEQRYNYELGIQERAFKHEKDRDRAKELTIRLGQLIDKELGEQRNEIALRDLQNQEIRTITEGLLAQANIDLKKAEILRLKDPNWFVIKTGDGRALMMNTKNGDWKGVNTDRGSTFREEDVADPKDAARNAESHLLSRLIALKTAKREGVDGLDDEIKEVENEYSGLRRFIKSEDLDGIIYENKEVDPIASGLLRRYGYSSLSSTPSSLPPSSQTSSSEHPGWSQWRIGPNAFNTQASPFNIDQVAEDIDNNSMSDNYTGTIPEFTNPTMRSNVPWGETSMAMRPSSISQSLAEIAQSANEMAQTGIRGNPQKILNRILRRGKSPVQGGTPTTN